MLQFSCLPHQTKAFSAFFSNVFQLLIMCKCSEAALDLGNEIAHVSLVADYRRQVKGHVY